MNPSQKPVSELSLMAVLMLAVMVVGFDGGMMFSAMPTMIRLFGDPVVAGWLITAYFLTAAGSCAVSSRLGDLYGRGRVLRWMFVMAILGSAIAAFAPTLEWIVVGRALQGISDAILPLTFGLARERLPEHRVPHGISYLSGAGVIFAGLGVFLGGVVVDNLSWHALFYASGMLGVVALLAAELVLPPSKMEIKREALDIIGGLLFLPAITLVLIAITNAKKAGWHDPAVLAMIGLGLALMVVWARYESLHPNPLIDVRQFRNWQIAITNLNMILFGLATSQLMLVLLLLLQQPKWTGVGLALSATLAGAIKIPSNLTALITAPWCARLTGRYGARQAALYGLAFQTVGWAMLTGIHDSLPAVVALLIFLGVGTSMTYAALANLIVEAIPAERTSEAIGVMQVVRTTTTAIGAQVVTFLLYSSTLSDPSGGAGIYPSPWSYKLTLGAITCAVFVGLLLTYTLPRRSTASPAVAISS
ncbi:MFS (Major facilitatotor superfamily) transporter [Aromatoleum petrolei]|nr:MFS (Major facilitatotor superfamily) transporter [Aromatoleum petrolei]